MNEIEAIERMTLYEYELRMRAYRLKMVDEEYWIYLQAWVNREVKAEILNVAETVRKDEAKDLFRYL